MIIDKEKIKDAVDYIRGKTDITPRYGIILGSGLGSVVDMLEDPIHIPSEEIPHFPESTVKGHGGRIALGKYAGKPVIVQEGRVHFYEGLPADEIMFPLFVMKALGVETIINTNSAGGINPDFKGGDLMLVDDHINYMFTNPLIGPNDPEVGPRFPDMSRAYDRGLQRLAEVAAEEIGIKLHHGILIGFIGPSYETRAEIAMAEMLGADAVGMSSVPECIVSSYLKLRFLAITFISNMVDASRTEPLTHKEVTEAAAIGCRDLAALIDQILKKI